MTKTTLWWCLNPQKVKTKMYPRVKTPLRHIRMRYLVVYQAIFQDRSSVLIEPTQLINLGIEESPKIIHVSQSLLVEEKENFTKFFQEKKINFTWTYLDMSSLDTDLIMHHLSISLGVKPIKKKLRKMHPHVAFLVKAELEKILSANFIQAIDYVEWISNIVHVSKHDKSIWVCTNFRELNKACPKDDFPLPNLDIQWI